MEGGAEEEEEKVNMIINTTHNIHCEGGHVHLHCHVLVTCDHVLVTCDISAIFPSLEQTHV